MNKKITLKQNILMAVISGLVFGIVACSGNMPMITPAVNAVKARLSALSVSGHRIMPHTSAPVEANLFFFAASPSQIAQSYDLQCSSFQQITPVPSGSVVPIPSSSNSTGFCNEFTSAPAPATDQPSSKPTFFDGTLSTLIVTGRTVGKVPFQCRDTQTQFGILDNSFTQAFLDPNAHKVVIFNQSPNGAANNAGFTCNNIGTDTDPVATIEVQFAKI